MPKAQFTTRFQLPGLGASREQKIRTLDDISISLGRLFSVHDSRLPSSAAFKAVMPYRNEFVANAIDAKASAIIVSFEFELDRSGMKNSVEDVRARAEKITFKNVGGSPFEFDGSSGELSRVVRDEKSVEDLGRMRKGLPMIQSELQRYSGELIPFNIKGQAAVACEALVNAKRAEFERLDFPPPSLMSFKLGPLGCSDLYRRRVRLASKPLEGRMRTISLGDLSTASDSPFEGPSRSRFSSVPFGEDSSPSSGDDLVVYKERTPPGGLAASRFSGPVVKLGCGDSVSAFSRSSRLAPPAFGAVVKRDGAAAFSMYQAVQGQAEASVTSTTASVVNLVDIDKLPPSAFVTP